METYLKQASSDITLLIQSIGYARTKLLYRNDLTLEQVTRIDELLVAQHEIVRAVERTIKTIFKEINHEA